MKNWLSRVNGENLITQLSIPGTHDSAAFHGDLIGAGFTQTQSWSIEQQLNNGIRFLDARCRLINNVFTMHHGPVYLHQQFGDVLNTCFHFLEKNPTEFIILSVKQEHTTENSTKSFTEVMMDSYFTPNKDKFYLNNEIPAVNDVRGKVILLWRTGSGPGINTRNWLDNDTFVINNYTFDIYVQDKYAGYTAFTLTSKREPVRELMERAEKGKTMDMYINFTSMSGALTPYHGANGDAFTDGVNKWFTKQYQGKRRMGIIVADYADIDSGAMVQTIINSNMFTDEI